MWWRESSSYEGANPIMRTPPSWPYLTLITSQRLLYPSQGSFRLQYVNWEGGHKHLARVLRLVTQSRLNLCDPIDCSPAGSSVRGDSPGKNTGVGCHALLQGIFPIQGSNPGLPHYRQILHCLSHQGNPTTIDIPTQKKYSLSSRYLQICLSRDPTNHDNILLGWLTASFCISFTISNTYIILLLIQYML